MKQTTKRSRSDSVTAQIKLFAHCEIKPPKHIRMPAAAVPFWESIVGARASEYWTDPDLETAAHLARAKAKLEALELELEKEDDIIENARGTMVANPKHALVETLTRRVLALSRALHVHANATSGDSRKEIPKSTRHRKVEKVKEDMDDLIPTIQ